jgi:hypothetical protein
MSPSKAEGPAIASAVSKPLNVVIPLPAIDENTNTPHRENLQAQMLMVRWRVRPALASTVAALLFGGVPQ